MIAAASDRSAGSSCRPLSDVIGLTTENAFASARFFGIEFVHGDEDGADGDDLVERTGKRTVDGVIDQPVGGTAQRDAARDFGVDRIQRQCTQNHADDGEDAEKVFGISADDTNVSSGQIDALKYKQVCIKLMEKFPKALKVIITLRGSVNADNNTWSGVLYDGKTLFRAPEYQITDIVDRVGGGDSFMGGLIYGLVTWTGDDQKALSFAVAASCLKHTIHGDYNMVSVAEVEQLMKGDASGRVVR